jgi:hypothetical protein
MGFTIQCASRNNARMGARERQFESALNTFSGQRTATAVARLGPGLAGRHVAHASDDELGFAVSYGVLAPARDL